MGRKTRRERQAQRQSRAAVPGVEPSVQIPDNSPDRPAVGNTESAFETGAFWTGRLVTVLAYSLIGAALGAGLILYIVVALFGKGPSPNLQDRDGKSMWGLLILVGAIFGVVAGVIGVCYWIGKDTGALYGFVGLLCLGALVGLVCGAVMGFSECDSSTRANAPNSSRNNSESPLSDRPSGLAAPSTTPPPMK